MDSFVLSREVRHTFNAGDKRDWIQPHARDAVRDRLRRTDGLALTAVLVTPVRHHIQKVGDPDHPVAAQVRETGAAGWTASWMRRAGHAPQRQHDEHVLEIHSPVTVDVAVARVRDEREGVFLERTLVMTGIPQATIQPLLFTSRR